MLLHTIQYIHYVATLILIKLFFNSLVKKHSLYEEIF